MPTFSYSQVLFLTPMRWLRPSQTSATFPSYGMRGGKGGWRALRRNSRPSGRLSFCIFLTIHFLYFYDINLGMFFPVADNFQQQRMYFAVACFVLLLLIFLLAKRYFCPECKHFALQYKKFGCRSEYGGGPIWSRHRRCGNCKREWYYSKRGVFGFEFGWMPQHRSGFWADDE